MIMDAVGCPTLLRHRMREDVAPIFLASHQPEPEFSENFPSKKITHIEHLVEGNGGSCHVCVFTRGSTNETSRSGKICASFHNNNMETCRNRSLFEL